MSLKNLGSKLASGVHKVKLKREQESAATPKKTVAATKPLVKLAAKPDAHPTPVSVAAKPVAPRTAQQIAASANSLHPDRIWPD